jgi:putative membrane protein
LAVNGASRTNLFSGDAGEAMMTYSRVTSISKLYTPSYYFFFSSPYQFIRTLILFVGEIICEIRARRRQERENVIPRLGKEKRGGIYPMVRAFTSIFLRDLTTHTLVGDILAGTFDAE